MENIESRMLNALELLHYCHRFRDRLFAFYFGKAQHCEELLTDLRVLHTAGIRQILFCYADDRLVQKLELWNRSGQTFLIVNSNELELRTPAFMGQLQRQLGDGALPIVLLPHGDDSTSLKESVIHCAVAMGATKVFFPGPEAHLVIQGRKVSCPTPSQLEEALAHPDTSSYPADELGFLTHQQNTHGIEIVRVEAERGAVFREVFTHFGSGTLFTHEFPDVLRQAHESDVLDILAIMRPYVRAGTLKEMTPDEVLKAINSFTLYTVNEQIVALAALLEYDDCYELAKLCTLPRYQARGRAKKLVLELIEKAQGSGKRGLFALTVSVQVGEFFESLGFQPCPRESLPEAWKREYDFSRPSVSYWFSL